MAHDPMPVARSYVEKHGPALGLGPFDEKASILVPDPDKSAQTAALYEKLKHSPKNPRVRAAYEQLAKETKAQFRHAQAAGMHFEPWTRGGQQPYSDSDHMRADVRENGHLFYFPTDSGFGQRDAPDHPLYEVDPETGLRYNDMFRAVHDYFAHAVHPHQFGPKGEIRAWNEHAKMFSKLARLAMTAETHGQNSWVNFGPHKDLPVRERPYAEQKATLMPITQHPTKLARPEKPSVFGRLKGAIFGRPDPGRTEFDGIMHSGTTNGRLDPDGYAKVIAEKSAVAGALQRLGAFSQRSDPKQHRDRVNLYTEVAHHLHTVDHPGLKPILDHYRAAASKLNAPDVVSPQPDKPALGEFPEPPNLTTHYTVPNIGPAGMELTDATVPLVRAIDRILAHTKPGHVALDDAKAPPEATLAKERELTRERVGSAKREEPAAVPPASIPPGHGDKFRVGLADMRKFRGDLRKDAAARPNEMDADLEAKPELPPLPLVNYPGEIGPTGDRYFDINKMLGAGGKRTDVVRHLMDKYGLSPKNAAAALIRFVRHKSNIGKTFKLARPIPKSGFTGTAADQQIGGSRFAYHLAQIADQYKGSLLGKAAKYALGLKGRDRLGIAPDSRLAGFDIYARIGKMLNDHAMPVADEVHRKMEKVIRRYQPTAAVHDAFNKLSPAQRAEVAQVGIDSARAGGTNTTPEAALGSFKDRAVARHFRDAYNWHKVDSGLALDRHVSNFLKRHIAGAADMGEDQLHTAAHRSYDLDRGAAKTRQTDAHQQFWDLLRGYAKEQHGSAVPHAKLNESLARLADRSYERQELAADTQKGRDPKPKAAPAGGTVHGWRDAWGWLPGAKHAKFQRPVGGARAAR